MIQSCCDLSCDPPEQTAQQRGNPIADMEGVSCPTSSVLVAGCMSVSVSVCVCVVGAVLFREVVPSLYVSGVPLYDVATVLRATFVPPSSLSLSSCSMFLFIVQCSDCSHFHSIPFRNSDSLPWCLSRVCGVVMRPPLARNWVTGGWWITHFTVPSFGFAQT
jgi:hypothetical protein